MEMIHETLIFVDGENLAIRYQEMIKAGRKPAPDNVVIDNCFVWNNRILLDDLWKIKRLSYYTSVVGDDKKVNAIRERIGSSIFKCNAEFIPPNTHTSYTGQFIPFVRKISNKSKKESVCDIAIEVDVMRACYRDHADAIWIFSGDGDFIQLFQEVVHSGKRAFAAALSSGLNNEIRYVVDEYFLLDKYLFVEEPVSPASMPA
jgi:uncharacterized LabA/DUF88 family protein